MARRIEVELTDEQLADIKAQAGASGLSCRAWIEASFEKGLAGLKAQEQRDEEFRRMLTHVEQLCEAVITADKVIAARDARIAELEQMIASEPGPVRRPKVLH